MSAERMMKTACTVIQQVPTDETDRHGDVITKVVEIETRCALQQRRRDEHEGGGEIPDGTWLLFLPWGTAIDNGAAVRVDGRRYELDGEPWEAQEGSSSMWHIEATVRRTGGAVES